MLALGSVLVNETAANGLGTPELATVIDSFSVPAVPALAERTEPLSGVIVTVVEPHVVVAACAGPGPISPTAVAPRAAAARRAGRRDWRGMSGFLLRDSGSGPGEGNGWRPKKVGAVRPSAAS